MNFHAFVRNDLDYAPFGLRPLRGVTPARLGFVAAFLFLVALIDEHGAFAELPFSPKGRETWLPEIAELTFHCWMSLILAALPGVLLVAWADRTAVGESSRARLAIYAAATVAGALAYAAILYGLWLEGLPRRNTAAIFAQFLGLFFCGGIPCGLMCGVLFFAGRAREAEKRLIQTRLERVAAERQIAEARLQLLRAQIEPHFLFNSLASVKRLYENDAVGGRQMLRSLGAYLRAALRQGRGKVATLGEEVSMARNFLDIFRERMGERLNVRIDVPIDLERARLPTLMLGTLVENAVKHGVGPRASGGSIVIAAKRDCEDLVVEVSDDGVGLRIESGTGVGLANTRARLQSAYPGRGDVELSPRESGGVTAALRLPLSLQPESSPATPDADETARRPAAAVRPETFLGRFRRILTWKHWAWALAAGLIMGSLGRLRVVPHVEDKFSLTLWAIEAGYEALAAILFMLAIVAVDASSPRSVASAARRYLAACSIAALVVIGAIWEITSHRPLPPIRAEHRAAARYQEKMENRGVYYRQLMELGTSGLIVGNAILGTLVFIWLRNARRNSEALAKAELERSEAESKLIASQVAAVEAEVDPAFMFSTLETVEKTYAVDRQMADAMLDELIAFLRAAIPKIRDEDPVESRVRRPAVASVARA